jgi:hypothetical protein
MSSEIVFRDRWFPLLAGLLATPILGTIAWAYIGGGDGSYWPATIFFPWAMLLAITSKYLVTGTFVLAAIQWPVYGLILNPRAPKFGLRMFVLCACHCGAVAFTLLVDTEGYLTFAGSIVTV